MFASTKETDLVKNQELTIAHGSETPLPSSSAHSKLDSSVTQSAQGTEFQDIVQTPVTPVALAQESLVSSQNPLLTLVQQVRETVPSLADLAPEKQMIVIEAIKSGKLTDEDVAAAALLVPASFDPGMGITSAVVLAESVRMKVSTTLTVAGLEAVPHTGFDSAMESELRDGYTACVQLLAKPSLVRTYQHEDLGRPIPDATNLGVAELASARDAALEISVLHKDLRDEGLTIPVSYFTRLMLTGNFSNVDEMCDAVREAVSQRGIRGVIGWINDQCETAGTAGRLEAVVVRNGKETRRTAGDPQTADWFQPKSVRVTR